MSRYCRSIKRQSGTGLRKIRENESTCALRTLRLLLVVIHTERRNGVRIIRARKVTGYEKGIDEQG